MMSLVNITKQLQQELSNINCDVFHYFAEPGQSESYIVWAETQEGESFYTDDNKKEQTLEGYVEFFTQKEFDNICDDIQSVLNNFCDSWELNFVEYLDEQKLIRYIWHWRIRG